MEAITITRNDYDEALQKVNTGIGDEVYTNQFKIKLVDGMNTASVLEICRALQAPTFENKVKLTKLCLIGKTVEVTCPNGEVEKFCMSNAEDNFDAFPLFVKEPLALIAVCDSVYGYLLKKYIRLSPAHAKVANAE